MPRLLHISASPRGARSKSLTVAEAFLETYRERNPSDEVVRFDVFDSDLPVFDGPVLQAKYNILHGQESSEAEQEAWSAAEAVIDNFKGADKYVFSLPMWNFGIPYKLKHFFDVIVQPGYTFSFDPGKGYSGLVTDKPVVAVYARGGEYSSEEAQGLDYQKPYIETILGFIGLTDVRSIVVEPTLAGGPETAQQRVDEAAREARQMAAAF